jgi:hypothetical protein
MNPNILPFLFSCLLACAMLLIILNFMVHQDIPRHMNIKNHISHIFHLPSYLRRISNWYPSTLHFQSSELLSSFTKPQLVSKRVSQIHTQTKSGGCYHPVFLSVSQVSLFSYSHSILTNLLCNIQRLSTRRKKK